MSDFPNKILVIAVLKELGVDIDNIDFDDLHNYLRKAGGITKLNKTGKLKDEILKYLQQKSLIRKIPPEKITLGEQFGNPFNETLVLIILKKLGIDKNKVNLNRLHECLRNSGGITRLNRAGQLENAIKKYLSQKESIDLQEKTAEKEINAVIFGMKAVFLKNAEERLYNDKQEFENLIEELNKKWKGAIDLINKVLKAKFIIIGTTKDWMRLKYLSVYPINKKYGFILAQVWGDRK